MENNILWKSTNRYHWDYDIEHHAAIINRRKYNTATAELLNEEHYAGDDHTFFFRKKNGEFFLYDLVLKYINYKSIYVIEEQEITPLTVEEAKDYVEENMTADQYEKLFGEVEE